MCNTWNIYEKIEKNQSNILKYKMNCEICKTSNDPFSTAIIENHKKCIFYYINTISDINKLLNHRNDTYLLQVIRSGDLYNVEYLILNGADPNIGGLNGLSPISEAARCGFADILKLLLNYSKIESHKFNAVMESIYEEKEDCLKILIESKVDINATTNYIENSAFHSFYTPLLLAAQYKRIEIAKLLISNKANIEYCNPETKETPLLIAAKYNSIEIINLLIDNSVDISRKNKFGKTAFDLVRGDPVTKNRLDLNKISKKCRCAIL